MTVYTPQEEAKRREVFAALDEINEHARANFPDWQSKLNEFEDKLRAQPAPEWRPVALEFDDTSAGGQRFLPRDGTSYIAQGYAPTRFGPKMGGPSPIDTITAIRLELLTDPNLPRGGPGRSLYGACALSEFEFRIMPENGEFENFDKWERVEIASAVADVNPPKRELGSEFPDRDPEKVRHVGPVDMAIDGDGDTAWTIDIGAGRTNQSRHAIFTPTEPVDLEPGERIAFRLRQNHGGHNSNDIQTNNIGRFRISVTDATELPSKAVPLSIQETLLKAAAHRTIEESERLFSYWRKENPELPELNARAEETWAQHPWGATQLVYQEMAEPRDTHLLERGDFLQPAEEVAPGTPAFLHKWPQGLPKNRLGLAKWLVDENAPTTARVYVNRIWQGYFGRGIVETPADFGLQGESPTHPDLLDWLAVEFMESGWNIKHIHRLIVQSATYRQKARATPQDLELDPGNRMLARGARFRVDGEIVRDVALTASGLLNREIGGPSVYPPAPEFIFQPPASYGEKTWNTETGDDKYRRALYTFRFRSVPYPVLQVFDTPAGNAPCVRRTRSNTPLQALTLLNEPMFLECAEALARESLEHGGANDGDRLAYAFRRCTSRFPSAEDLGTLLRFLEKQRTRIDAGELDPVELVGEEDQPELAAWTLTARVLLNLDETITRQ